MAKFTTRIALRDATTEDYEKLDAAMLEEGFTKTLKSSDNGIFILPAGEYNMEVDADIKEIYLLAEKLANATGRKNWILTSETINRMWKLQEIFD
jgi:hypothetical protein